MLRAIFEVNLFGLTELTNRFIPAFRKQKYGRIVNISSVLGEISIPLTGPYCASKRALEAATDSMRCELFDSGIGVSIVQPGPIDTNFSRNLAQRTDAFDVNPASRFSSFYKVAIETRKNGTAGRTAEGFMKPPEAVAEAVFQCLEKRRPPIRVRVTAVAHFGAFARRFLPAALIDAITISKLRKKLR
jgi:short-subunit dehydrogenase